MSKILAIVIGVFLVTISLVTVDTPSANAQLVAPVQGGVVGFRVFPNPEHLRPIDWYNRYIPATHRGNPREIIIDGYEAVEDGRSVYVNAASYNASILYTNIYVFSYDSNDPDGNTKRIFDEIRKNLHFTVVPGIFDTPGQGYCLFGSGLKADNSCTSDFDCGPGDSCFGNTGDEIRRDTKRSSDIVYLDEKLRAFKNTFGSLPQILSGSYVSGISFSAWPSWRTTLSSELGIKLFNDPINRFVCPNLPDIDQTTCWNVVAREFSCPSNAYVYGYEYASSTPTLIEEKGSFGANFETPEAKKLQSAGGWSLGSGAISSCSLNAILSTSNDIDLDAVPNGIDNCTGIINPSQHDTDADGDGDICDICPFDADNDSDVDGICADVDNCPKDFNQTQSDVNNNGIGDACDLTCGDGVVDPVIGEDCDPLVASTPPVCIGLNYGVVSCSPATCLWDYSACIAPVCSNGILEPGEICEIGDIETQSCTTPLTGYAGFYSRSCTGSQPCTWSSFGTCTTTQFCGDSVRQGNENCDNGASNGPLPALCSTSCVWNTGTTCGNGSLQFGEQCGEPFLPTSTTCVNHGLPGGTTVVNTCTASCTWDFYVCTGAVCGDNTIDTLNGEECEPGVLPNTETCGGLGLAGGSTVVPCAACTWNTNACTFLANVCGNGVQETYGTPSVSEECDDGNFVNGDGCGDTCKNEYCSDTLAQYFLRPRDPITLANMNPNPNILEQCDDGNLSTLSSDDYCTSQCQIMYCGDGIHQPWLIAANKFGVPFFPILLRTEQCDNTTATCDNRCQII